MEDKITAEELGMTNEEVIKMIKDEKLTKQLWEHPNLLEEYENNRVRLGGIYEDIISILKNYCDIEEKYYSLIAIWIIGTYVHKEFPTYPYLFFNAMKGSGKSRILRLITTLSKDGSLQNSMTEAVLFRTTGTLGIDEFEGLNKKGKENLLELLNSAYKKGIKVKRMKKVKKFDGESQEVEEFEVYRPIVLANISGMDAVLNDRCITITLEKSCNPAITKMVEMFENDQTILDIHQFPFERCRWCSVYTLLGEWNKYIKELYTSSTHTTFTTPNYTYTSHKNNKNLSLFNKLNESGIDGRNLELTLPLLIIANFISEEIFNSLLEILKDIITDKKEEDSIESLDISLYNFISQEIEVDDWVQIRDLFFKFKDYVRIEEDWFNEKWMGRALKRLVLFKKKKRLRYGMVVKLDYKKAQKKMEMFK